MKNYKSIAPDYPRIPHLSKNISNISLDDEVYDDTLIFPLTYWVGEKVDGANTRIGFNEEGPILGNRNHILKKGYIEKDTPAKLQFRPAWNWVHEHEDDIKELSNRFGSELILYGEWMLAYHSLEYDRLSDFFLCYDLWSPDFNKFLSPSWVKELSKGLDIEFINFNKITFDNLNEIRIESERKSDYRNGLSEGIVLKTDSVDGKWVDKTFKVVNRFYIRRDDFNERGLIKNKLY